MAFEKKNEEIKKALGASDKDIRNEENIKLPVNSEWEKKAVYPFSLKPSSYEKLKKIASQQNYKSTSKFLNDLIDSL